MPRARHAGGALAVQLPQPRRGAGALRRFAARPEALARCGAGSCLPAAQGFGRDCDRVYYWAVTLPLQVEPAGAWPDAPAGGAAGEVTVRAGSFAEAQRVLRRFAPRNAPLACLLDGAGGVRSVGGPNVTAPVLPAAPAPTRRAPAPPHTPHGAAPSDPSPLALALLHAAWGSLLGRVGAAARPPPAWLSRLGWLPWARCCGPGVPLVVLSTLPPPGTSLSAWALSVAVVLACRS